MLFEEALSGAVLGPLRGQARGLYSSPGVNTAGYVPSADSFPLAALSGGARLDQALDPAVLAEVSRRLGGTRAEDA